jgi:hypothetical protein
LELLRVLVVGPRVRTTIERARREKLENRKRDALVFVSGEGEQLEHARRGMRR